MSGEATSPVPAPVSDLTDDTLLGGRVRLRQPRHGYRAAIDPVLLAAATPATPGASVLDVGTGSGAAALALAARVADCRITGLEVQRDLVRLAAENVALNGLEPRVEVMAGDLRHPPPRLAPGSFDVVMANPPHLEAGRGPAPPDPGRAAARVEGEADLAEWIRFAALMVRPKGAVVLIHRADRLDALLAAVFGRLGEIAVYPLWPVADGRPAKRVLVRGRKGVKGPLRLLPGLVLHHADGSYTDAARAVLADAAPLEF